MESQFEHVSALEGIRQLVAEFSNSKHKLESRGVLFYVHSGKRIHLRYPNTDPPRSALVRLHGGSTFGYTTETPYGDPVQDHSVEVVRDYDQQMYFVDQGQVLFPGDFAAKLLDLVASNLNVHDP